MIWNSKECKTCIQIMQEYFDALFNNINAGKQWDDFWNLPTNNKNTITFSDGCDPHNNIPMWGQIWQSNVIFAHIILRIMSLFSENAQPKMLPKGDIIKKAFKRTCYWNEFYI